MLATSAKNTYVRPTSWQLVLLMHPTVISDSFHKVTFKAIVVLMALAVLVELTDRESLIKSMSTSLNSKVVS